MRRKSSIILVILIGFSVFGLFHVKHKVQNLKKELLEINRQLASDRAEIHVLEAEWAYLNEPSRIKKLAEKYLQMEYLKVSQLKNYDQVRLLYFADNKHDFINITPTLRPILSSARNY